MLVGDFLKNSAQLFPNKTAIIFGKKKLTYVELDVSANRLANALISFGIRPDDRVGVFLDNSAEAVIAIFAILKANATFVVVNPTTKLQKLTYILNDCRMSGLIAAWDKSTLVSNIHEDVPSLKFVVLSGEREESVETDPNKFLDYDELLGSSVSGPPASECIDQDLAAIIYTSGTTGVPKGVMMTHLNMVSACTSITTYLENTSSDIILDVLPLSFDYGLYQLLMGFKIGGTVVLEKTFLYPFEIIKTVIREKVTGFPGVPTIFALLLQLDRLKDYDLSHLRYITNTAAALPVSHVKRLQEVFPRTKIYLMYGLTECKRVSYLAPDQLDRRPDSVGRGMPNEEVYIVDEQGERVKSGEIGELVVRGSNVMRGYWELPEETDKLLRPGKYPGERVLYTGDLFRMDEDGYLYFVARKDDIIKTRGEKVSPKEVENVLYRLDGVLEAAVMGISDPILGEAVKAVVVLKKGANITEEDLRCFCAQNMEDFMVPKIVEFRESLPKTETGKIKKMDLTTEEK
jgi:amino acid adenylation domain-containing protein